MNLKEIVFTEGGHELRLRKEKFHGCNSTDDEMCVLVVMDGEILAKIKVEHAGLIGDCMSAIASQKDFESFTSE